MWHQVEGNIIPKLKVGNVKYIYMDHMDIYIFYIIYKYICPLLSEDRPGGIFRYEQTFAWLVGLGGICPTCSSRFLANKCGLCVGRFP